MTGADILAEGGNPDWMTPILQGAGSKMDAVAWHYYPLDSSQTSDTSSATSTPAHLLQESATDWPPAGLDFAGQVMPALAKMRDQYAPNAQLWIDEFAEDSGKLNGGGVSDRVVGALWAADALGRYAENGANAVFKFVFKGEPQHLYTLVDTDNNPRPEYYAYWLYAQHFGDHMVATSNDDPADVAVHSAVRSSDGSLRVMLVNKTARAVGVHLDLADFAPRSAGTYLLQGDSADATAATVNSQALSMDNVVKGQSAIAPQKCRGVRLQHGDGSAVFSDSAGLQELRRKPTSGPRPIWPRPVWHANANAMLHNAPLGKDTEYTFHYDPSLLFPIARRVGRDALGLREDALPFDGVDIWNAYEVSWLDARGKPEVAVAEFQVPALSPFLVESKSLKLYLNTFSNSRFAHAAEVERIIARDVGQVAGSPVRVKLIMRAGFDTRAAELPGIWIDGQEVSIDTYDVCPDFLTVLPGAPAEHEETLFSDLLKSNCPVTGQPDWGSVQVTYRGARIDPAGLLRYIVSFRNHTGFHEQCVEHIFRDIKARCRPTHLTVYARYTRRGGLDINPFRSDYASPPPNRRLYRQ